MSAVPGFRLARFSEGGRSVLRVLGHFDGEGARDLVEQIRRERSADVVVDVALVHGFDEVGVATLARLVETGCGDRRIALRGLSTHQLRILRYLGVGLSALGAG